MISVVFATEHCDDFGMFTSLEIKLKLVDPISPSDEPFASKACAAVASTTLYEDVGNNLKMSINKKRPDIVDFTFVFDNNNLTDIDIANFKTAVKENLKNPLF